MSLRAKQPPNNKVTTNTKLQRRQATTTNTVVTTNSIHVTAPPPKSLFQSHTTIKFTTKPKASRHAVSKYYHRVDVSWYQQLTQQRSQKKVNHNERRSRRRPTSDVQRRATANQPTTHRKKAKSVQSSETRRSESVVEPVHSTLYPARTSLRATMCTVGSV